MEIRGVAGAAWYRPRAPTPHRRTPAFSPAASRGVAGATAQTFSQACRILPLAMRRSYTDGLSGRVDEHPCGPLRIVVSGREAGGLR